MFGKGFQFNDESIQMIDEIGKYMPNGFFIFKADDTKELLYANKALISIFGCKNCMELKNLTVSSFSGMIHNDDREAVLEHIKALRFNTIDEPAKPYEFRINCKDGSVHWVEGRCSYIETEDKTGIYFAFVSDITEKHDQEERLAAIRNSVDTQSADKLEEISESISSLLSNMPAMSFLKDSKTGKYLACNQPFAEYAHKSTPAEVVGLTDHEIFDKETADHFVEDDKKALSMDEPHIFYEIVPNAASTEIRSLQTTKLRFRDTTGKLCLLGMCVDVTEMTRIKNSEAVTLAKQQVLESRIALQEKLLEEKNRREEQDKMITALASDYRSVYHIDLDKNDAVCYRADYTDTNQTKEGIHFPYLERFGWYAEHFVDENYREDFLSFIQPDNIRTSLSEKTIKA